MVGEGPEVVVTDEAFWKHMQKEELRPEMLCVQHVAFLSLSPIGITPCYNWIYRQTVL
jgi:hypothetical protein